MSRSKRKLNKIGDLIGASRQLALAIWIGISMTKLSFEGGTCEYIWKEVFSSLLVLRWRTRVNRLLVSASASRNVAHSTALLWVPWLAHLARATGHSLLLLLNTTTTTTAAGHDLLKRRMHWRHHLHRRLLLWRHERLGRLNGHLLASRRVEAIIKTVELLLLLLLLVRVVVHVHVESVGVHEAA